MDLPSTRRDRRLGCIITVGSSIVLWGLILSCVSFCAAHADEIERINQHWNAAIRYQPGAQGYRASSGRGSCQAFAGEKYRDDRRLSYPAEIWIVRDERGEAHAVTLVGDVVQDNRFSWTERREVLSRFGYEFLYRCELCERAASQ